MKWFVRRRVRSRGFPVQIQNIENNPMQSRMGPVRSPRAVCAAAAEATLSRRRFRRLPRPPAVAGSCFDDVGAWDAPNAIRPIYSGKNPLSMNAFSGFGDHFDRERRPDGGFQATYVRGKVLREGDGLRSE